MTTITGTIKSANHRYPTINPLTSNGVLVADLVISTDDGKEIAISVPIESHTGVGKRISVYQGSDGEWLIDEIELLSSVEMFPWLGNDFNKETGMFEIQSY